MSAEIFAKAPGERLISELRGATSTVRIATPFLGEEIIRTILDALEEMLENNGKLQLLTSLRTDALRQGVLSARGLHPAARAPARRSRVLIEPL